MSPNAMAILRAARRFHSGTRQWTVPGCPNAAKLMPTGQSGYWPAPAFAWPHQRPDGEWQVRSVRLDWHRGIAKAAALELLKRCG